MIDQAFLSNLLAWSFQAALLTVVAVVVLALLRVESPPIRYAWWRGVLALVLVLPLVQPWEVVVPAPIDSVAVPVADEPAALASSGTTTARAVPSLRTLHVPWLSLAGIALVAGALVRLAWLVAGILRLRQLRNAGQRAAPCDGHEELVHLIEAGAEIRYVSSGQPVTFGVLHPVVLLPHSLRARPESVQRAVLAHELWHVRRRDWMWMLLEESIRAVLWFHPAIWFLVRRVQATREEVVDELTILATNSRRGYLEALLAFADEPPLFAAAPFARRRHLFQRMLLISREAVMSSRKMVVTCAAMPVVLAVAAWTGASQFPLIAQSEEPGAAPIHREAPGTAAVQPESEARQQPQSPPRDQRPGQPRPAGEREAQLKKAIAAGPQASVALYYELARLQEVREAIAEAEATLLAGRAAFPGHDGITKQLAAFYDRRGQFDKAVGIYEELAAADPSNPATHNAVARFYEEKLRRDPSLGPAERGAYIQAAIDATNRALTYKPDFGDALTYKSILLRYQAALETDSRRKRQLIAEADALRNQSLELTSRKRAGVAIQNETASFTATAVNNGAVRVGGNIAPPAKIRDVRPAYPPDAQANRIQGVVIIEVLLDTSGRVKEAKILRSIPDLDEAALAAVKQWEFTPTLLNGVPTPVIMTVTVNFTLE